MLCQSYHIVFRNCKIAEEKKAERRKLKSSQIQLFWLPFFLHIYHFLSYSRQGGPVTVCVFLTATGWKDVKDLILLTRPTIFSIPSRSRLFCSSISTAFQRMVSGASLILCTSEARWMRGSFQERSTPSIKFSRSSCCSPTLRKGS